MNGLTKVWKKMKIWEVSACGIPMYPMAHKAYSLNEALKGQVSDELNMEKKSMEDSEEAEEAEEENSESESEETSEEKPAEAPAVQPGEAPEEKSEEAETEKSVKGISDALQNAIVKGFRIAIKEAQTERGLVSNEKSVQEQMGEELNKKSIGELAVMSGLFQKPATIGATREFE